MRWTLPSLVPTYSRLLSAVIPPIKGVAPPARETTLGVWVCKLKSSTLGRLERIQALLLSGLRNICCAVKLPAPRSKLAVELCVVIGQPALSGIGVNTRSTLGES